MEYELLKANFSKYANIPQTDLSSICEYYEPGDISKKSFLLRQGEICRFEAFVVKGCFKIYTHDSQGNEKTLYFAAEGWWIMEINSFMNATASALHVQALEDSRILSISKSDKEKLYSKMPSVERLFRIMSQVAIGAWQERLIRNHSMSAEERYHHFINTYPKIASRLTNKQIASYLGITHEFVSKIRKKSLDNNC